MDSAWFLSNRHKLPCAEPYETPSTKWNKHETVGTLQMHSRPQTANRHRTPSAEELERRQVCVRAFPAKRGGFRWGARAGWRGTAGLVCKRMCTCQCTWLCFACVCLHALHGVGPSGALRSASAPRQHASVRACVLCTQAQAAADEARKKKKRTVSWLRGHLTTPPRDNGTDTCPLVTTQIQTLSMAKMVTTCGSTLLCVTLSIRWTHCLAKVCFARTASPDATRHCHAQCPPCRHALVAPLRTLPPPAAAAHQRSSLGAFPSWTTQDLASLTLQSPNLACLTIAVTGNGLSAASCALPAPPRRAASPHPMLRAVFHPLDTTDPDDARWLPQKVLSLGNHEDVWFPSLKMLSLTALPMPCISISGSSLPRLK